MKKILLVLALVCMSFVPVSLQAEEAVIQTVATIEETEIKQAYDKIKNYYTNDHQSIQGVDDIYAMYALQVPIDVNRADMQGILQQDFAAMPAHTLAKNIIALVMAGVNPHEVGQAKLDLVELLVSYVGANGAIEKDGKDTIASLQVWCLYALEIVDAEYDAQACYSYLQSQQVDGGFGYGAGADADISAWVLDALLLNDTYKNSETVTSVVAYLKTAQHEDGTWGDWGANANTQSSVLQAYITYNKAGILNGDFSKNGNPMQSLLSFQNDAGWFGYMDNVEYNWFATYQGAMTIGCYYNGPIYARAKDTYKALVAKPIVPVDPIDPDTSTDTDTNIDNTNTDNTSKNQNNNTTNTTSTPKKVEVVPTGDRTSLVAMGLVMSVSLLGMHEAIKTRKEG